VTYLAATDYKNVSGQEGSGRQCHNGYNNAVIHRASAQDKTQSQPREDVYSGLFTAAKTPMIEKNENTCCSEFVSGINHKIIHVPCSSKAIFLQKFSSTQFFSLCSISVNNFQSDTLA
jgi:hypothetical protein